MIPSNGFVISDRWKLTTAAEIQEFIDWTKAEIKRRIEWNNTLYEQIAELKQKLDRQASMVK